MRPRAFNTENKGKENDQQLCKTYVRQGASLGANATILCGIETGRWVMVGAGSVVTHDIPDHGLEWGAPSRLRGLVCNCGTSLKQMKQEGTIIAALCTNCGQQHTLPAELLEKGVYPKSWLDIIDNRLSFIEYSFMDGLS